MSLCAKHGNKIIRPNPEIDSPDEDTVEWGGSESERSEDERRKGLSLRTNGTVSVCEGRDGQSDVAVGNHAAPEQTPHPRVAPGFSPPS
jgi:hypothetical protein